MAKFTAQQANNCVIDRCEAVSIDSVHAYWLIEVLDENGIRYSFENTTIPGTANDTAIRSSLQTLLLDTEKIQPLPVIEVVENETIIGTTVGE